MQIRIQLISSMRIRIWAREPKQCGSRSGFRSKFSSQAEFLHEKKYRFFLWAIGHKTYRTLVSTQKPLEDWKSGLFVNSEQFSCSWIRIQIRIRFQESEIYADPCRSGSHTNKTMLFYGTVWNETMKAKRPQAKFFQRNNHTWCLAERCHQHPKKKQLSFISTN